MPRKFNADRRDKIPKQKHRVTNWPKCNEGLGRRGDFASGSAKMRLAFGRRRYEQRATGNCVTRIWRLSFA